MSGQSYTGDVQVGGPADVRELPGLTIRKLAVSEMANNAYLLTATATGEALLVDAAAEPDALLALVDGADVRTVVTTHGHWDHHRALAAARRGDRGADRWRTPPTPATCRCRSTRPVEHGDTLQLGDQCWRWCTCGDTRPGDALVWRGPEGAGTHVFTGDSLFPGGVGTPSRTPPGSAADRRRRAAAFRRLPDDTWVYPGHGKDTTIGAERPHLAEWRERGW